jgi:RNA-binding protein YhbY
VSELPEIIEALIIRDPQPNDVVVVRLAETASEEDYRKIAEQLSRVLRCEVLTLRGDITIESIRDDR